jgi:hypothetical protein
VVDERKSSGKRIADLASQSVSIVAKEFLHSATLANEERISIHVHRDDDPLVFLTAIAAEFVKLYTASECASKQYPVVFIPTNSYEHDTGARFGSEDIYVKEVGDSR